MNISKYASAMVLSLCAMGASAQGYNTNCTRDYHGNISCRTTPDSTNESSLNELRQILGTPTPTVRGISPADTANLLQQYQLQQYQYQQHQLQQQQLRCSQVPIGMGAALGCY